ncbi:MAG: hypothetical protein KKB03_00855 [Nanoarchaeota archaeon]|nr:hypothetical protein [Nanoarchaeota archaeon]
MRRKFIIIAVVAAVLISSGLGIAIASNPVYIIKLGTQILYTGPSNSIDFTITTPTEGEKNVMTIGSDGVTMATSYNDVLRLIPTSNALMQCNLENKGVIYYSSTQNKPCYCDGSEYKGFDGENC